MTGPTPPNATTSPLVFISHDHRDAAVAEAFELLVRDASAGILRTFRSSARLGPTGIEYGREWYKSIMSSLQEASELVALVTPNSVGRPWILYEAGVAAGRLEVPVLGLVLGMPLENANVGPFAQFQNSTDDEDSLTGLLQQIVTRNTSASPRPEAIRVHAQAFRNSLPAALSAAASPSPARPEDHVPRMFEEIKAMFRELSSRVGRGPRRYDGRSGLRSFHRVLSEVESLPPSEQFKHYRRVLDALVDDQPTLLPVLMSLEDCGDLSDPASVERAAASVRHLRNETPPRMLAADDRSEWRHAFSHLERYLEQCLRAAPQSQLPLPVEPKTSAHPPRSRGARDGGT